MQQVGLSADRIQKYMSIHASRVGCNVLRFHLYLIFRKFQFMHPGWDATQYLGWVIRKKKFQFMHPGWDATPRPERYILPNYDFNSCIPGGMQLQDLDIILLYLLYLVFIYHFLIHPYLKSPFSFYFSVRILQCFYVCFIFAPKSFNLRKCT